MSVSRRKFLSSGAAGALSAGLISTLSNTTFGQKSGRIRTDLETQIPAEAAANPIIYYTREAFEPCVGSVFQVRAGSRIIHLTLVSVTDYKPASTAITTGKVRNTETFELRFQSSVRLPEFSTIHRLEHPVLGSMDLYLERSETKRKIFYSAVINRVV